MKERYLMYREYGQANLFLTRLFRIWEKWIIFVKGKVRKSVAFLLVSLSTSLIIDKPKKCLYFLIHSGSCRTATATAVAGKNKITSLFTRLVAYKSLNKLPFGSANFVRDVGSWQDRAERRPVLFCLLLTRLLCWGLSGRVQSLPFGGLGFARSASSFLLKRNAMEKQKWSSHFLVSKWTFGLKEEHERSHKMWVKNYIQILILMFQKLASEYFASQCNVPLLTSWPF